MEPRLVCFCFVRHYITTMVDETIRRVRLRTNRAEGFSAVCWTTFSVLLKTSHITSI